MNKDSNNIDKNMAPPKTQNDISYQLSFNTPYKEQTYKDIFKKLGIRKISLDEKVARLGDILKNDRYDVILKELTQNMDQLNNYDKKELLQKQAEIVYKYTKFHGYPFLLKFRKLDLERYYMNVEKNTFISHAGIFFEKDNTVYQFVPVGVKYGESEYNKESSNDWILSNDNQKGAFFTLMKIKEIEYFAKKWNETFDYNHRYKTSEIFAYTLLYWLF